MADRVAIFEFDTDGFSVERDPNSTNPCGPRNVILVPMTAVATADAMRDAIIIAINKANIGILATSGGAATVLATAQVHGAATITVGENVAAAGFTMTITTAGSLSGVVCGQDREDLDTLDLWTTGATVPVNIVLTLWVYSLRAQAWLDVEETPVTPLVPKTGNNAGRSELLGAGVATHDRMYLQAAGDAAAFGTGGKLSAAMYSKGQRRTAA